MSNGILNIFQKQESAFRFLSQRPKFINEGLAASGGELGNEVGSDPGVEVVDVVSQAS